MAWMFLPQTGFHFTGFPDYTKMSATCIGVLLAASIFDSQRLFGFRPRWFDLPLFIFCLAPVPSSLANDLGLYNGLSVAQNEIVTWFLPYLIGRVYFNDLEGMRELAYGILIGGLVYVPFCIWEMRMSPQLHRQIYGRAAHSFAQQVREGGYRPMVFMQHGLMVAMFMASASIIGVWGWYRGAFKTIWYMPAILPVGVLLIVTLFCRSAGAMILIIGTLGSLFTLKWLRLTAPIVLMIMAPPAYMFARTSGLWSGQQLVPIARTMVGDRPAESLGWRITNEADLLDRAMERPLLGWGGWGRARIFDDKTGRETSIVDGLWLVTLGDRGILSLVLIVVALQLPVLMLLWRYRVQALIHRSMVPPVCLAMMLVIYGIDMIPNAMLNPIFMLGAGGLSTFCSRRTIPARADTFQRVEPVDASRLYRHETERASS
jgi:hypothetical protein